MRRVIIAAPLLLALAASPARPSDPSSEFTAFGKRIDGARFTVRVEPQEQRATVDVISPSGRTLCNSVWTIPTQAKFVGDGLGFALLAMPKRRACGPAAVSWIAASLPPSPPNIDAGLYSLYDDCGECGCFPWGAAYGVRAAASWWSPPRNAVVTGQIMGVPLRPSSGTMPWFDVTKETKVPLGFCSR